MYMQACRCFDMQACVFLQDIRAIACKLNREKLVLTTEPLGSVASEQTGMFQLRLVRQSVCHGIPGQPWSVVRV